MKRNGFVKLLVLSVVIIISCQLAIACPPIACPPCYSDENSPGNCEYVGECESYWYCGRRDGNHYACDCSEDCECNADLWEYWCEDGYGPCYYNDDCSCECSEVESISADPIGNIAVGDSITFTATLTSDETAGDCPLSWSCSTETGKTVTAFFNEPSKDLYVTAETSCQDEATESATFDVVEVNRVEYNDPDHGWIAVSDPMYVHLGTTVSFKAFKDPCDAFSWPSNKPEWGGAASGTGETIDVTFNSLSTSITDYITVTVECGNVIDVNVVVYEFEGVDYPAKELPNRSPFRYGVDEFVELRCGINPGDLIDPSKVGGIIWYLESNGYSTIFDECTDGSATLYASPIAHDAELKLKVLTGPSKGDLHAYDVNVVAPSSVCMMQIPDLDLFHDVNWCSVGIPAVWILEPDDVSFSGIRFREGTCIALATGCFSIFNGKQHEIWGDCSIWNDLSIDGLGLFHNVVANYDKATISAPPPFSPSSFTWPIPNEYRSELYPEVGWTKIDESLQKAIGDPDGRCTIEKNGAGPDSLNSEADSCRPGWYTGINNELDYIYGQ